MMEVKNSLAPFASVWNKKRAKRAKRAERAKGLRDVE